MHHRHLVVGIVFSLPQYVSLTFVCAFNLKKGRSKMLGASSSSSWMHIVHRGIRTWIHNVPPSTGGKGLRYRRMQQSSLCRLDGLIRLFQRGQQLPKEKYCRASCSGVVPQLWQIRGPLTHHCDGMLIK